MTDRIMDQLGSLPMQVSSISSQFQNATNATRLQAVHEQPAFAQLLAAADSDKTTPNYGSNINPNTVDQTDQTSTETPPVSDDLRKAFSDFVGQTFFSELIKSYRSTQQEAAYFNGGRAEKIFQGQLDQIFAEELSESSAEKISEPMFEQFKRL